VEFSFFFNILFIYLREGTSSGEGQREREKKKERERSRLPAEQEAQHRAPSQDLEIMT